MQRSFSNLTKRITPVLAALSFGLLGAQVATANPYDDLKGEITYSGTLWEKGEREIEGHWLVDELTTGERFLRLGDDFKTKSAPDLKLILSTKPAGELNKRNVLSSGTVLGLLTSASGAQTLSIPDSVDLSEIESIAIHCEQYNVFWGAAPFNPGRVVYSGDSWTKKTNKVKGSFEIAQVDGGHVLRTSADFSTRSAPDLKFVFSNHTTREAKNGNALRGGAIIAPLYSAKGAQEVEIPDSVDPASFSTLLIHCEQYTKLWAAVPLTAST